VKLRRKPTADTAKAFLASIDSLSDVIDPSRLVMLVLRESVKVTQDIQRYFMKVLDMLKPISDSIAKRIRYLGDKSTELSALEATQKDPLKAVVRLEPYNPDTTTLNVDGNVVQIQQQELSAARRRKGRNSRRGSSRMRKSGSCRR